MGFQFDIYRNTSDKTHELQPYFMIIQHDYYDDLSTRLILPLSYCRHIHGHNHAVTPLVNIDFQKFFLNTPGITHVERKKLNNKNFVCNLRNERSCIVSAIDALITNT